MKHPYSDLTEVELLILEKIVNGLDFYRTLHEALREIDASSCSDAYTPFAPERPYNDRSN